MTHSKPFRAPAHQSDPHAIIVPPPLANPRQIGYPDILAEGIMAQRVLVVEDDPMNVKFMSVILKRRGGFDVFVSEDPEEIVKIAKEENLNVILMDISLANSVHNGQKVDGLYITKLLKSIPETASIPVIIATAHAMIGDREHFLGETGAEHYIPKPFTDPEAFLREVRSVIKE